MSEISSILEKLKNTSVHDILVEIESAYERISDEQANWYETSKFTCPSGCGSCCNGFEPDIFEGEALYMAAWLLENQPETAFSILNDSYPFDNGKDTCPMFNPDSPYHCSIYEGRPFICRLFGAAGSRSRTGEKVWRPCKFYPETILKKHIPPIEKRQYNESETLNLFGTLPPIMSDLIESTVSFAAHAEETLILREILPQKIKFILWLIEMNDNNNPNGSPSNTPFAA